MIAYLVQMIQIDDLIDFGELVEHSICCRLVVLEQLSAGIQMTGQAE